MLHMYLQRWDHFMQACNQYLFLCDDAGKWSATFLFAFMDVRLEIITEEERNDRIDELKKPVKEFRFAELLH